MTTTKYVPQHVMKQATLVAWTTGMGAVTPEALAERDHIPVVIARERLDEAVQLGLLERHSLLIDHPWARCRTIEATIYFAETRKIEEQLWDAVDELKAEEMIVVNPLSEILKPLPGFRLTDD